MVRLFHSLLPGGLPDLGLNRVVVGVVNHLLQRAPDLQRGMIKHAGKLAFIHAEPVRLFFLVRADGSLGMPEVGTSAEQAQVSLNFQLSDVPAILGEPERAFSFVKISGDADFANSLSEMSEQISWDIEADLAPLFGDVLAVRIAQTLRIVAQQAKISARNLQENFAEFFVEEYPLLARADEVPEFTSQVNQTRDDIERLMKRIEKLERRLSC